MKKQPTRRGDTSDLGAWLLTRASHGVVKFFEHLVCTILLAVLASLLESWTGIPIPIHVFTIPKPRPGDVVRVSVATAPDTRLQERRSPSVTMHGDTRRPDPTEPSPGRRVCQPYTRSDFSESTVMGDGNLNPFSIFEV